MWLSGVCRRGYLDWIYSLTFLQPTRVPKIPIFHRDGAKVFRLFRWNIEKILYCFFIIKASGGALLSTSVWMGSSPSLGINLNHLFLLEQHLFECTRDLLHNYWMTPLHGWPQIIKRLKPCLHKDWMELITSSSASPGHISTMSHTSGIYCSPSIQTSHKTGPSKSLAGSLDDGICFSIAFVKLMITILFTNN